MNLRENNAAKIEELDLRVRWAATALEALAWENGLAFEILEVYRTQERQNQLYKKGREMPGGIVTWTKKSKHTERLAMDVRPYADGVYRFYEKLAQMAKQYGITAPLQKAPYYDMGHFEFCNVGTKPINGASSVVQERLRLRLIRKIAILSPKIGKRLLDRINAKFGTSITL